MKNLSYILATVIFFSSCTKVIELDIKPADKKYVIEGQITDQAEGCRVLISQTKDFYGDNNFPRVSGAEVSIKDAAGNTTLLAETAPGVYTAAALTGTPGSTYSLLVKIAGKTFTSTSTMALPVNPDKLYVNDEIWLGEAFKLATIEFSDPGGKKNYYFFRQLVNGVKRQEIYFLDDDFSDGNQQTITFYMFPDTDEKDKIKKGDNVEIQMMGIDAKVYAYWFSAIQSATGSNSSSAPSNPVTNIEGGALGYFSAQTFRKIAVAVQ